MVKRRFLVPDTFSLPDFGRTAGRRNDEQKTNRSRMLAGTTFTHVASRQKHLSALFRQLGNRRQMLAGLHGRALAKARGPGPIPGDFARSHSSEKRLANLVAVFENDSD